MGAEDRGEALRAHDLSRRSTSREEGTPEGAGAGVEGPGQRSGGARRGPSCIGRPSVERKIDGRSVEDGGHALRPVPFRANATRRTARSAPRTAAYASGSLRSFFTRQM